MQQPLGRTHTPATLFTRRQNDPRKNYDDENVVLPPILDLSGGDKDSTNSDDDRSMSWKISKKGSSSSTKASSGTVKPSRTRSSPRYLMKEALEKNKSNTNKGTMEKKRV